MQIELADESNFQLRGIESPAGLAISALPGGCIYSIACNEILINQILGSPAAGGVSRIYLRLHEGSAIRFVAIAGPHAASEFSAAPDRLVWSGSWQELRYRCTCWLHPQNASWFFHVEIENRSARRVRCDAVLVQDIGLASRGQLRNNELFSSQYIDHFAIEHAEVGDVLMSRQNLSQPGDIHPWLMQGCFPRAAGFTTDGFDFFGVGYRGDGLPRAMSRKVIGRSIRQYETAYTAIQSTDAEIAPGAFHHWSFFAYYLADHPDASSAADLNRVKDVQAMREEMLHALRTPAELVARREKPSIFARCELYHADDFDTADLDRLFSNQRRHVEIVDGQLLSFFCGDDSRHVVLKAKELSVARPHGHIMRSGPGFSPDAPIMSCACYAAGIFMSQLTMGNTSLAKLLSGVRDPLNIIRSSGLRVFVRRKESEPWQLLGVPSAFDMRLDRCTWHYKQGANLLAITCSASEDDPAFTFGVHVDGTPIELLICGEIVASSAEYDSSPNLTIDEKNGRITIRPDPKSLLGKKQPEIVFHIVTPDAAAITAVGGDEILFPGSARRGLPYFGVQTRATRSFTMTFVGALKENAESERLCEKYETATRSIEPSGRFWKEITADLQLASRAPEQTSQLQDTLAWFARDAIVHLGTPRGLEQPNGGAWGVRDVCQGPVEFLLSYGHDEIVAVILRKVFSQQYLRRRDWPQWFMFPPFQEIQSRECHGDVLIWPLKALCDYLEETNDAPLLRQRLPYTDEESFQLTEETETVQQHVDRLLDRMREQFLPGVALPRYGEGDWDDSLQPADPMLRERMVSSWTAALMYQTLRRWQAAMTHFGDAARAATAQQLADAIDADFQRYLLPGGTIAGFALFSGEPARPEEFLLHPSDQRTGLRYRLIPITRGILSGIFSADQATHHLDLLREHLLFPDGARLMDRPTKYHGGTETVFRRSESAAFFGREIGLQYVHAHLRYAEAAAKMGLADELWHALRVVNPIAVTEVVSQARPRQRNCYFSSSDAAFTDRYQASRDYDKLRRGEVPTDGGWRIYSSGPGVYTNVVIRHLFGLRRYFDWMEFDPILPREMDGATCELVQFGRRVRYEFSVKGDLCSPKQIAVNGQPLSTVLAPNPYRAGGVRVRRTDMLALLTRPTNVVQITS